MDGLAAHGIGLMLTPNMRNRPDLARTTWACDTGAFSPSGSASFSLPTYLAWLEKRRQFRSTCLFATAPDVVGDAVATWVRSKDVLPQLRALGYRAALVAQDGMQHTAVEWDAFDALFIGGTTGWKLSEAAYALMREANDRGKWVHAGRVNSLRRLQAMRFAGAQSADGTFLKYAPETNLARVLRWLGALERQPALLEEPA